jgi:hypothetical protein
VVSRLKRFYSGVMPLGDITTSTGPTTKRQFHAFKLTGRKRDIEPIGGCSEVAE